MVKYNYIINGFSMGTDTKKIMECYNCGLFLSKLKYEKKNILKCPRCNSKITLDKNHSLDSLYYSISALLLFIILNIYPLITLNVNESVLKATLIDTVLILLEQNFFLVALIVFFTVVVAPVLNSLVIIISFFQMHTKIKIFSHTLLHDAFHFFKHWGFIEVFIISLIVTYIKLLGMVSSTKFDIGFYVMLLYVFCLYMSNMKFEGKNVLGD